MMRKEALANRLGEWEVGNLIFKEFRNQGILDELKNRKYKVRSKELTLESLNEDILMEKQWIEAEAYDGTSSQNFAFYATNKYPAADLRELEGVIAQRQIGTYKQSLEPELLQKIRNMYKSNPSSFSLRMIRSLPHGIGSIP